MQYGKGSRTEMNNQKKISEFVLGCNLEIIRDFVVLAPCWTPKSVGITNNSIRTEYPYKIYDCETCGREFTYIVSGIGAGVNADIVMALEYTSCKRVILCGSAGALDERIAIGDVFVPFSMISAEGASRFLQEDITIDNLGKEFFSNESMFTILESVVKNLAEKNSFTCYTGKGVSVDSIYSQSIHIPFFERNKCMCIDMEAAAVFAAAQKANIKATAVFSISDNVMNGEPLHAVTIKNVKRRKEIQRHLIIPIVKGLICKSD